MPYADIKKYQEYQKKWREAHPDYFKEYYQRLKNNKKEKVSLSGIFKNLFKGGKK